MRRLEVVGKSFQFTGDNPPQYKSLSFQVQVIRDQYNVVRAEFFVEGQELQTFLDDGMNWEQLAEEKMKWILETNTTPVDAYMLEGIQREQREIADSVEATKQAAVQQAAEEAAAVAQDAKIAAIQAASTAAVEAAQEVAASIKQAAVNAAVAAGTQAAGLSIAEIKVAVRRLVPIYALTPDDIGDLVALYDPWQPDETVTTGDIRSYEGKLYKVVQAHTTQADWTPDITPALWTDIAPPATEEGEEIVPEWVQPTGAHDAYKKGDKVLYDNKVYESTIDANVWSPADYPQGWKEVID